MAHHHERQVCGGCGAVIMQCRCMEPKVDRVVCDTCKNCNVATAHPYTGRPGPGVPVMTPVSDAMLDDLRVADKEQCASRVTQSQINVVIAELLALRRVADAAEHCLRDWSDSSHHVLDATMREAGRWPRAALRDAGRLP